MALAHGQRIISEKRKLSVSKLRNASVFFHNDVENAKNVGMKVYNKKTQLVFLCVVSAAQSNVETFIRITDDEKIFGQPCLKQLGFAFGTTPGASAHIDAQDNDLVKLSLFRLACVGLRRSGVSFSLNGLGHTSERPGRLAETNAEDHFTDTECHTVKFWRSRAWKINTIDASG